MGSENNDVDSSLVCVLDDLTLGFSLSSNWNEFEFRLSSVHPSLSKHRLTLPVEQVT